MKRALQAIFLVLVLAAIGQPLWQHAQLPLRVASHFDASGQVDGWSPRKIQTTRHLVIVLLLAVLFSTLTWCTARYPADCPGLPHQEYWLAAQRRASTAKWLACTVLTTGCLVLFFVIGLRQLAYHANLLGARVSAGAATALLGGLLVAVLALLGTVLMHFGRKPAD